MTMLAAFYVVKYMHVAVIIIATTVALVVASVVAELL
jgi:hypothetical protein